MFVLLSETFGKFSSPGVAVYQYEALEYCSLADSLSMKSTPEESGAQEGAEEKLQTLDHASPEAASSSHIR